MIALVPTYPKSENMDEIIELNVTWGRIRGGGHHGPKSHAFLDSQISLCGRVDKSLGKLICSIKKCHDCEKILQSHVRIARLEALG